MQRSQLAVDTGREQTSSSNRVMHGQSCPLQISEPPGLLTAVRQVTTPARAAANAPVLQPVFADSVRAANHPLTKRVEPRALKLKFFVSNVSRYDGEVSRWLEVFLQELTLALAAQLLGVNSPFATGLGDRAHR